MAPSTPPPKILGGKITRLKQGCQMDKFTGDLDCLLQKLVEGEGLEAKDRLIRVREQLAELRRLNLVKINHSVLELLCAKYLIDDGYEVDVERQLSDLLTCDVYGVKGDGSVIVEVETGYIPPEHALDPGAYNQARIVSKIARYSQFSDKFILGTTPANILNIPKLFRKPPRDRREDELREMKALCDRYYMAPPIEIQEIKLSRLYTIYILDVDRLKVVEIDLDAYLDMLSMINYLT